MAIAVYALVLYGWHLRPAFEGAVRNDLIHVLQHQSFIAISLLVWWPALQPERRRMPGHLWKIGHVFSARLISIFLGMPFVFGGHSFYPGIYGSSPRNYGLSPLADQQFAGGTMMSLDIIIITFARAQTRTRRLDSAGPVSVLRAWRSSAESSPACRRGVRGCPPRLHALAGIAGSRAPPRRAAAVRGAFVAAVAYVDPRNFA